MLEPGSLSGLGLKGNPSTQAWPKQFLGPHISRAVLRQGQSPEFPFQRNIPP